VYEAANGRILSATELGLSGKLPTDLRQRHITEISLPGVANITENGSSVFNEIYSVILVPIIC
jgi:hypothetical protein